MVVLNTVDAWCALDFPVDRSALLDDFATIQSLIWQAQSTASVDQRIRPRATLDWAVVPLRAPNGDPDRTDPGLPGEEYGPTPLLGRLPGLSRLLASMPCETAAVRLMRLIPNAQVKPHVDSFFGLQYGKVRLHVPLITSRTALMVFGEHEVHWTPDRLWYGDFSRTHTVRNGGPDDRVHLVLDCLLSPELLALFPPAQRTGPIMINRSRLTPQPEPPLPPGEYPLTVARRALDWTRSDAPELDRPVAVTLLVEPEGMALRMPSGVLARLHAVGDGCYRVGRMPEETTVRVRAGQVDIVRRVGNYSTVHPCS
ncbi:aspartyl/asparaginyl beta-hydroxylase domain-containing protein [Micromonospora tarensis]|uniref:Aspartyl/asparaginyl beta-hydroxylase domain-containing protein n=1 Tax=Micromonospora tarensis TaxID=2806100 RepID=A0ABS1YDF6_9ACTN|nr:aspartyl/asparaginyl beta-hydroxylase domain-containing protein [Micromonospora tarensis]MBM0275415.1 aspartyl/asparaginyl beta-hydroxylase domain-containing protein [Micromonospora tarensis]